MEKLYFMGNCQTLTYAWYLKRLLPDLDVKWLQSERFLNANWTSNPTWSDVERVFNLEEVDSILNEGCFLITNHDNENKSHFEDKYPNTTITTITCIYENIDGFEVAQADLQLRGPGEILGARQSGMPMLRYADIERDTLFLEAARRFAPEFLAHHPKLAERHIDRWYGTREKYSEV